MKLKNVLDFASRTQLRNPNAPLDEVCAMGVAFAREQLNRVARNPWRVIGRMLPGFERYLAQRLREVTGPCLNVWVRPPHRAVKLVARHRLDAFEKHEVVADLMRQMFSMFPALAGLWLVVISDWKAMVTEFVRRLEKDCDAIAKAFMNGAPLGPVLELRAGLSDPHRGGRTVVEIRFGAGRVIYKPRSGKGERAWFRLLRWMNSQGYKPQFTDVRTLLRRGYCWMEVVQARPCDGLQGIKRFYTRFGGTLFLAHHLGLVDCHRGNVIAAGEHPVLVDIETLFHPAASSTTHGSRSLLETGLLPLPSDATAAAFESSPLCGASGPHSVTLKGTSCHPERFQKQIVHGFEAAKRILSGSPKLRRAFLRRRKRLQKMSWRRIMQPTLVYWQICQDSVKPQALRSLRARHDTLVRSARLAGLSSATLRVEIAAMARLDVPYFLRAGIAPNENFRHELERI